MKARLLWSTRDPFGFAHVVAHMATYEKPLFFSARRRPFHAAINLGIVSFWRDNNKTTIGLGWGRSHIAVVFAGFRTDARRRAQIANAE